MPAVFRCVCLLCLVVFACCVLVYLLCVYLLFSFFFIYLILVFHWFPQSRLLLARLQLIVYASLPSRVSCSRHPCVPRCVPLAMEPLCPALLECGVVWSVLATNTLARRLITRCARLLLDSSLAAALVASAADRACASRHLPSLDFVCVRRRVLLACLLAWSHL